MKNLLFLFLLISTLGWAQTTISEGTLKASVIGTEKIPVSGSGHPVISGNRLHTYHKARFDSIYGVKLATLAQFAATTSAQLRGVLSDETGTGAGVFATAPTLSNPVVGTQTANDNSTKAASTAYVDNAAIQRFGFACSDLTTGLTTGTTKGYISLPAGFTVTGVFASILTAQASGSILTIDINEAGTTILSTKLSIDNSENTSLTAATPAVISDSSIAAGAILTADFDTVGSGGAGVTVWVIGHF